MILLTMDLSNKTTPAPSPILFNATPVELEEEARSLNYELHDVVNGIVQAAQSNSSTFSSSIQPFIHCENKRIARFKQVKFYSSTHPSKPLRNASTAATKLLSEADLDLLHRDDFFAVVDAVSKNADSEQLTAGERYYLRKLRESFEQNGATIKGEQARERYKIIQKRLGELQRQAIVNLNEDSTHVLLSPEEAHGLPADMMKRCAEKADKKARADSAQLTEADEAAKTGGKMLIEMKEPDTMPVAKYVANKDIRRRVARASADRCPENKPIYREVFVLRDEAARIMGFENHASFRLHYKMVHDLDTVNEFLRDLQIKLKDRRDAEIEALRQVRFEFSNVPLDADFTASDRLYYDRVLRETKFSYDQVEVAEYFSLDQTLQGMFKIFEHLFGIRFHKVVPQEHWTWHPDVSMFAVWDEDESVSFLGYLYLDLFPRQGKYTHAGHYGLQPGFMDERGAHHNPCAALVMNLPPPTATKPSLLKHEDLRRLFHEIGHSMHNLLSRTLYARFHGTSVDRDFVEAPSMMFEHFLWIPEHVRSISQHYSYLSPDWRKEWELEQPDGRPVNDIEEKIPQKILAQLIQTKHVSGALKELQKLWMASFDLAVHSPATHQDIEEMDIGALWHRLRADVMGWKESDSKSDYSNHEHGWSAFRAIMGAYDAGYYTYLLAQVYSCDLFYTGFRGDTSNAEKGRRYRYLLLEPGGSQPEIDTLQNFLGRKPSSDAFCTEYGI